MPSWNEDFVFKVNEPTRGAKGEFCSQFIIYGHLNLGLRIATWRQRSIRKFAQICCRDFQCCRTNRSQRKLMDVQRFASWNKWFLLSFLFWLRCQNLFHAVTCRQRIPYDVPFNRRRLELHLQPVFLPILLVGNFHASFVMYETNLLTDPGKGSCDLSVFCLSVSLYQGDPDIYTHTHLLHLSVTATHHHPLATLAEHTCATLPATPRKRTQTSIN